MEKKERMSHGVMNIQKGNCLARTGCPDGVVLWNNVSEAADHLMDCPCSIVGPSFGVKVFGMLRVQRVFLIECYHHLIDDFNGIGTGPVSSC